MKTNVCMGRRAVAFSTEFRTRNHVRREGGFTARNWYWTTKSLFVGAALWVASNYHARAFEPALSADSFIALSGKQVNEGAAQTLSVDAKHSALFEFDLSTLPPGTTSTNVVSATLTVFVSAITKPGSITVSTITGAWSEAAIPTVAFGGVGDEIIDLTTAAKNHYVQFDVTALVQGWIKGTIPNNGVAIVADASGDGVELALDSKENTATSHPAHLDITLEPLPGELAIGTVTTGTAPAVTLTGTPLSQILNFTLAPGVQGVPGTPGAPGSPGPANTLGIGTVAVGSTAAASITGTAPNQTLNLTLPQASPAGAGASFIYGDGSAGDYIATSGTLQVSNPQFGNFTVPEDVTLHVPSGTTIRCSGSFTNLGTIIVDPAGGIADYVYMPEVGSEENFIVKLPIVHRGIAMTGAGSSTSEFYTTTNVSGGVAFPAAQVGTIATISSVGGGSGGGYVTGSNGDVITSSLGGGACRIICSGPLVNSGEIDAVGEDGMDAYYGDNGFLQNIGGGAGGGGIVILASASLIVQDGTVNASGGDGGDGDSEGYLNGGGGGGGGLVRLLAPTVTADDGEDIVSAGASGEAIDGATPGSGGGACAGNGGDGNGDPGTDGIVLIDECNPAALLGN